MVNLPLETYPPDKEEPATPAVDDIAGLQTQSTGIEGGSGSDRGKGKEDGRSDLQGDTSGLSKTTVPHVPSLPTELLHDIASQCDKPTLLTLCISCSVLREIASPLLYKSLSFSDPEHLAPFLLPPASPRFAKEGHTFTLDRAITSPAYLFRAFQNLVTSVGRPSPRHYPALPLPSVRHIYFYVYLEYYGELEDLLSRSRHLIAPLDPLSIGIVTYDWLCSMFVKSDTWTAVSTQWRSLQVVTLWGAVVFICQPDSPPNQHSDSDQLLPWKTTIPTAPLLELHLAELHLLNFEERPTSGLGDFLRHFDVSLDGTPFPNLTIRLSSEKNRLRFVDMLDGLPASSGWVKDATRVVVGKRNLEGLA